MPTNKKIISVYADAELLHSQEHVEAALDRMAIDITKKLKESNPLVICVMIGGVVTTGKLVTRLNFPLEVDYLHASRYQGKTAGKDLKWIARPVSALKDRSILIVDDILDEGYTLSSIIDFCQEQGAREIFSAVLVEKRVNRNVDVTADFIGLEVENKYVFGYGMDYKDSLRNAPGIFAVKD